MERFLDVYGSMGILAGIVQAVYLGAAFWLGGALVRRSRELPARLLGIHLLLSMGVGYLLVSAGVAVCELHANPPRALVAPLLATGYAATILGLMATLVFTHRVFRPGQRGSRIAVGISSGAMWIGWIAYGASGGFARGTFEGLPAWLLLGPMLGANAWIAAEPLAYHAKLRRRLRVGLAEPLVADRFLLWGCGSLARMFMILAGPAAEYALQNGGELARDVVPGLTLGFASLLGLATSVCFWLTFAPTHRYERWALARYERMLG